MKHTYKLKDGSIVPGTTTIANMLDKPQLIDWAWKLGKEGKDWRENRDSAGDIGTLVHKLCIDFISGEEVATTMYGHIVVRCFKKFLKWWGKETKGTELQLMTETPIVSEVYRFGGTPDILVVNKNKLIDIKTAGGIYESYWIQLAAYGLLLRETGYKVNKYQILWLPKDDRFDDPIRKDLRKEQKIFKHLLGIYQLRKEL